MYLPVKNIVQEIDLKPTDCFLPLFEAVVNSIISLKKTTDLLSADKKIQVRIIREEVFHFNQLFPSNEKPISEIKVIDNGEGFTDANYSSFETAYSDTNKKFGCKG